MARSKAPVGEGRGIYRVGEGIKGTGTGKWVGYRGRGRGRGGGGSRESGKELTGKKKH